MHQVATAVLTPAHLGEDNSAVLALAVDVIHFGDEASIGDGRVEDVVEVDRQDAEEAFFASGCLSRRGQPAELDAMLGMQRTTVYVVSVVAVHAFVPAAKLRLRKMRGCQRCPLRRRAQRAHFAMVSRMPL